MARTWSLLLVTLLAAAALSGCMGGDDDDDTPPTPTPSTQMTDPSFPATATPPSPTSAPPTPPTSATLTSSTYALEVAGIPTQAKPGARVEFTLFVNGSVTAPSDHIGAHFADNDTTTPPVAPGRQDCEHTAGSLPGTYSVNCTLAAVGTWYIWGHARINNSGELLNWWTPAASVVKVRDYNLTLSNVPTNAQTSGSNFTVVLNVTALGGSDNASSDHIGAHFWNASEANPTTANKEGDCIHVASGVVGPFSVTCSITNPGLAPKDYFVRGHIRITESGTALSWWSAEHKVSILGGLPASPI